MTDAPPDDGTATPARPGGRGGHGEAHRPGEAPPLDHLAELARVQAAFLAGLAEVDHTAPVPWCGRWRVSHLAVHLARIHHWAAAQARGGAETPLGRGPFDVVDLYARCAAELRTTLAELGPDHVGSTLIGPGPARFWHRRQLHETLVHLWDLRTAGGLVTDEPATLWADTVDEVVTVMQPRQVALGRMAPLPVALSLVATDAERAWVMSGAPEAADLLVVTGTAADLALLLWGRRSPAELGVDVLGDEAVLADVLAQALTP